MNFVVKSLISGILIALISTVAKQSKPFAALIASLPLTSILAFVWIYQDSKNKNDIAILSMDIFWLVIPSLLFFVVLNVLLKKDFNFYLSLMISCGLTALAYGAFIKLKTFLSF